MCRRIMADLCAKTCARRSVTILLLGGMTVVMSCNYFKISTRVDGQGHELLAEASQANQGYKIAFGDERNIYMMNPDGSEVEMLARGGNNAGYISWSPNAEFVYFICTLNVNWDGYRVKARSKEVSQITDFGKDVRSMGVSPDGRTLAISVMTGNSTTGDNNDDLSVFSTNLFTISIS